MQRLSRKRVHSSEWKREITLVVLTEDQVKEIKKRLMLGETAYSLAKHYNVKHSNIYGIKYGKTWKEVTI